MKTPVQLKVVVADGLLSVDYALENQGKSALYVAHRMRDWFGITGDAALDARENLAAPATTTLANVSFEAPDTAVLLVGRAALPKRIVPSMPRNPDLFKVEPGGSLTGTLSLRLPLREWGAHSAPAQGGEAAAITRLVVRFEAFAEEEGTVVEPLQGAPGYHRLIEGVPTFLEAEARVDCTLIPRPRTSP